MLCILDPGTSRPRSRSASPSMLFRCRVAAGQEVAEPRPRLDVTTHAFPSRSTTVTFVVSPSQIDGAREDVDERQHPPGLVEALQLRQTRHRLRSMPDRPPRVVDDATR